MAQYPCALFLSSSPGWQEIYPYCFPWRVVGCQVSLLTFQGTIGEQGLDTRFSEQGYGLGTQKSAFESLHNNIMPTHSYTHLCTHMHILQICPTHRVNKEDIAICRMENICLHILQNQKEIMDHKSMRTEMNFCLETQHLAFITAPPAPLLQH